VSLLLDTHALLWWLAGELDADAVDRIADPSTFVAVSAASVWEVEIKRAIGKLEAPPGIAAQAVAEGFEALPMTFAHAERAGTLPPHHRDPFDRMLAAQCEVEGLTLVTRDPVFGRYGTPTVRC